ncbi:UDP-N-acetylglucosamine 2-epimerase (non-hydrolyzing) [Mariprofundus erugo]|uniref:UDP-N-acetylglucosamine 2-epimerase (Non-hydrolyzing) n=1 Tax=Mariprofundus erugo TaxID=2528639 RepID=A0A5R9GS33_9PROT|nr:UDP-N-acetylglucosamine 2-epimerase (non-hydrolyzing) [Mariprofundus erugo]TLS69046.1 UDP-N-acetylglucosamine 2-epimerase (non-hydrolyzing) [Mariprofundus erugo]
MKIMTIVGARPQFVKAAVVSREMNKRSGIHGVLLHTGQHYDANMSDVFFDELDIPRPDYHLGIGNGTHGQNTGRMIEAIERVLFDERPDWVLVYGDTDSTLAGVIAAVKLHIPVAHVEAGLRSFNRKMPEEYNRVLADHASTLLFAPTAVAERNLAHEGIPARMVQVVGDVMYDASLYYGGKAESQSDILRRLALVEQPYILATVHRQENTDDKQHIENILEAFSHAPCPVVWPVHPRTHKQMRAFGLSLPESVVAIDPLGYLDMVKLEKNAALIATDSGGVQKEAYFYGVPCITLRGETEWVELVDVGANRLVATDVDAIIAGYAHISTSLKNLPVLYGNGDAGCKIVDSLQDHLSHV